MNFNFIPQVFYDLIARLIPGSILIWSLYLVYYGSSAIIEHLKKILNNEWDINFLLIIATLLTAYIISIIFNGLWTLISKSFDLVKNLFFHTKQNEQIRIDVVTEDIRKAKQVVKAIQNDENIEIPSTPFVYDYIRLKRPDVGSRLVKIKAEIRMCKVLIFGWIILIFLNLFNLFTLSINEFLIIECTLLISTIGVLQFLIKLDEKLHIGLDNYWILLHLEQQVANQNKDCE